MQLTFCEHSDFEALVEPAGLTVSSGDLGDLAVAAEGTLELI